MAPSNPVPSCGRTLSNKPHIGRPLFRRWSAVCQLRCSESSLYWKIHQGAHQVMRQITPVFWETKKRHSVPSQETFSADLCSGEPADREHGQTGSGMLHCLSLPCKENVALRCRIGRPQRGHNSDCGDREDTPAKKSTMACFRSVWLSPSVESRERSETPGSCKDKVVIGD